MVKLLNNSVVYMAKLLSENKTIQQFNAHLKGKITAALIDFFCCKGKK
jgi:hypothetical protein